MPYQTGQASSSATLLADLKAFAVANGFTVTGDVFHSANSFTKVSVYDANYLSVQGFGAANGTTEPAPNIRYLEVAPNNWPVTYYMFVHPNPIELFCIVKYGAERHTWLSFGELQKAHSYPGGGYYSAPAYQPNGTGLHRAGYAPRGSHQNSESGGSNYHDCTSQMFFGPGFSWENDLVWARKNTGFVRANYAGDVWTPILNRNPQGTWLIRDLWERQPNAWNGQAVLLPIRITIWSGETGALVDLGSVPHARYLRIDNYVSGDLAPLGTDNWMVFPFHRKDTSRRNMEPIFADSLDHTGTYGWAIRYDGP